MSTWASFSEDEDHPPGRVPEEEEAEVIHAAMARTVRTRRQDTGAGKCRMSGVPDPIKGGLLKKCSGHTQVKNRARKAATQIELRQYRLQFQELNKTNISHGLTMMYTTSLT